MDKQVRFSKQLKYIKNEKMRTFIGRCIDHLPDYFFTVSASSSGKYHPEFASGEGGLVRHVKAGVEIANELFTLDMFNKGFSEEQRDVAIAALLLHDGVKRGIDGDSGHTNASHPQDMAVGLRRFWNRYEEVYHEKPIHEYYRDMIADCIASHMGQWNNPKSKEPFGVLPLPETRLQKFVHLCDYLASRKFINFKDL